MNRYVFGLCSLTLMLALCAEEGQQPPVPQPSFQPTPPTAAPEQTIFNSFNELKDKEQLNGITINFDLTNQDVSKKTFVNTTFNFRDPNGNRTTNFEKAKITGEEKKRSVFLGALTKPNFTGAIIDKTDFTQPIKDADFTYAKMTDDEFESDV